MQRVGYKDVLVSVDELLILVPSAQKDKFSNTIYIGMRRYRELKGKTWVNIQDSSDKRKRMIYYTTITVTTREKYNLPDVSVLIQQIKDEKAFERFDSSQRYIDREDYEVLSMLENASEKLYIKFCPQYLQIFPNDEAKVITYARTHSVLNTLIDARNTHKIKSLHRGYMQISGLKSQLTNYNEFCEKLAYYAKNGINLIHKLTGSLQNHVKKITEFHIGKMEQYYSHPNQYTYQMVTELLNADCKAGGLKEISVESVKKYLLQPQVKNRLSYYRSKEFFNKNIQPFSRRKSALYSGDLYYADGSPIQIFLLE